MLVVLLAGCRSFETRPPEWRALEAYVERSIEEWDVPGASIAVVHDGTVYTAGFGVRSLETREPVTPDTQFRAASVTKMHTAMAILTLAEDGVLDPALPVTDQIPGFALAPPYQASSMTVDQLLTHSSGLQASGHVKDCESIDPADLEPWVLGDGATWVQWTPPDVLYDYSNVGFAIAGLAAQDVAGEPYAQLMDERVLGPLGMTHSTFDVREASENHAVGHNLDPITHEVAGVYDLDARGCATEWPYGGLITTAPDLARTVQALLSEGDPVLRADTYGAWVNGGWEFSSSSRYSYGISSADDYLGHRLLSHGGAMEGYLSSVAAAPDDDWGIVILVNADHATTWPTEPFSTPTLRIFLEAMSIYLGTPNDPVDSTVRDPLDWSIFTGDYYEQFTYGDLSVRQEGDELWLHIADPDPRDVPLQPYSANTFKYDRSYETIYQSSISFSLSDDGTSVDWVFLGDGIASVAPDPLATFGTE
jgi:CubicO group peptidase (beta-lactamase class C family)